MIKKLIPVVALVFMAACGNNSYYGYDGENLVRVECSSCCDKGHCKTDCSKGHCKTKKGHCKKGHCKK